MNKTQSNFFAFFVFPSPFVADNFAALKFLRKNYDFRRKIKANQRERPMFNPFLKRSRHAEKVNLIQTKKTKTNKKRFTNFFHTMNTRRKRHLKYYHSHSSNIILLLGPPIADMTQFSIALFFSPLIFFFWFILSDEKKEKREKLITEKNYEG